MGTSAITLSGAMQSNLLSLDNIQSSINTVQQALTTGKSVNSPTDNALVYFEAQQGYNQASSLNNLKDAMSQGLQTIQTSLPAIGTATTTLQQMQAIAQQALNTTDTTTQTNLQTQYNQLQGQLNQITQNDGNYLGTNLLSGQPNNNLVIDFNASNTSSITIAAVDTTSATYQPTQATGWVGSPSSIQASETADADAVTAFQGLSTTLGAYSSYITARQNFTSQLSSIFTTGANSITAADMNQESADMLALQTQQSLGVSALSLANQANQSVLRLFQ
jgi:flagellin-like hook-associated protein FlgL